MKSVKGKILFAVVLAVISGIGIGLSGRMLQHVWNAKTVVFRVGNQRSEVDYDLQSALDYMAYLLGKKGYRIAGKIYNGDLYPAAFDNAGVNVFVRGFLPFYDARMNKKGKNLFYLHRVATFYEEELRHYDSYLFSQQTLYDKKKTDIPAVFFSGGAVPHVRLIPKYETDVLYIYEEDLDNFSGILQNSVKAEMYGGVEFAALSVAEREAALRRARVVMYRVMSGDDADYGADYVPYAVYDIMSYGRPLVTNRREKLEEKFAGRIWLYDDNIESKISALQTALGIPDNVREEMAANARDALLKEEPVITDLIN